MLVFKKNYFMFYGTHFPKTGGTSLLSAFRQIHGPEKILSIGRGSYNLKNLPLIKLLYKTNSNINNFQFVSGHHNNFSTLSFWEQPESVLPTTFLLNRDPLETFWSSFYQSTIEGKQTISPEDHLDRRGHSPSATWHEKKYAPLTGDNKQATWEEIFKATKYLIFTKNISTQIPLIHPDIKEILQNPRRVRKNITKDFQPHPLQESDDFNRKVKEHLSRDYEFIRQQQIHTAEGDLPSCTLYEESYLKDSLINMQKRLPKSTVASKYASNFETNLIKKIQSLEDAKAKKMFERIDQIFESINASVPERLLELIR